MESTNLYHHHQLEQQQQQQEEQLVYPSLSSSSSSARVSTTNEPIHSMVLGGDDFNRCMNDILPNSREYFWPHTINLPTSVKILLEADHEDSKSCDLGCNNSDCFLKLSDMNGSILKNNYIKNGQHDVSIDLNENLWIGSFSHGHTNQKLSTNESYSNGESFARFAGLAPSPPNYIFTSTSESKDQNNFSVFDSTLPSLPLATEILDCSNYDAGRTHESFEERISSVYCQVQKSSDSPSNSSNKTSAFRKEVSRTKTRKSTPSHEVAKKPRLVPHSSNPTLKVRKEKLGDRIAALHRLVSPFGKTDTASVLTEATGYIQFLQDQIQTLSMSCSKSSRSKSCRSTRGDFLVMEEHKNQEQRAMQDLKSRGLCLVPLALTSYVCCSYNGSI